jgi:hypothetical protein
MKTHPSNRWFTYTETRCDEVLRFAAANDCDRLLFLARHHLGTAERELVDRDTDEPMNELAQRIIVRRLLPGLLALTLMSEIDFSDDE